MDFELSEAGKTFLAGAYFILTFIVVTRYAWGHSLINRVAAFGRASDGSVNTTLITATFVGFSFALGLLVEDSCAELADRYVFWPHHYVNATQYSHDHRHGDEKIEGRLQQSVLFESVQGCDPNETPLGTAVMKSQIFSKLLGHDGFEVELWAQTGCNLSTRPKESIDETRVRRISQVFFFAKNRLYLNESYGEELRRIDSRQEFSSTVATISLLAVAMSLLGGAVRHIHYRDDKWFRRYIWKRAGIVAAAFAAIYFLAFAAFIHETEEFNRRVFGYYDSMLGAAAAAHDSHPRPSLLP